MSTELNLHNARKAYYKALEEHIAQVNRNGERILDNHQDCRDAYLIHESNSLIVHLLKR